MADSHPRCFISYSWDSDDHKDWVLKLARELENSGVEVALDRFTVRLGDNLPQFMEVGIRKSDFVLLICTPMFAEKANDRTGGVGYESQIVTGEVFQRSGADKGRFIPVLRAGDFDTSIPSYLKGHRGVDLRDDINYERELEELVRHLWSEPAEGPGPLGPRPEFRNRSRSGDHATVSGGSDAGSFSRKIEDTAAKASAKQTLAEFLRELRVAKLSGPRITQRELGEALGGSKPISAPLISSWEAGVATPSRKWLDAYASFFSTPRSIEQRPYRLLRESELTPHELAARRSLLHTLQSLHTDSLLPRPSPTAVPLGGLWHFHDGGPVLIVCGEIPVEPLGSAHGRLHSFADLDAAVSLYGHIRASNPHSRVHMVQEQSMDIDDYTTHLVVLGTFATSVLAMRTRELLPNFPVRALPDVAGHNAASFEVDIDGESRRFEPKFDNNGQIISDVGLFLRTENPFNRRRTLTLCSAAHRVGVEGVVSALTDERFRQRNEEAIKERFPNEDQFSILMRILVIMGEEAVTPDWTMPRIRLHEWPARRQNSRDTT